MAKCMQCGVKGGLKQGLRLGASLCDSCQAENERQVELGELPSVVQQQYTGGGRFSSAYTHQATPAIGTQTARTVRDEQSNLPIKLDNKSAPAPRILIAIGIVIALIGVALIIISPNFIFHDQVPGKAFGVSMMMDRTQDFRDVTKFFGVALLIVGGIVSAIGFAISTQKSTPPAPTTHPIDTQSVSPKSIELGNTPDEVQSVMGQPDKIMNLGARVIHVYKDMKIIYVDGKVSDVQLS